MLYFTAKKDLRTIQKLFDLERNYVDSYWALLGHMDKYNMQVIPTSLLPDETVKENAALAKQYTDYRMMINESVTLASRIADRYGVVDPTHSLLTTTHLPDFSLSHNPGLFNNRDKAYWLDNTYVLIGAIKERKREDFWRLINPFYWVFAMFRSLLTSTGLGKMIGDSATKIVSGGLTAVTAVLTPWLEHFVQDWVKKLLQ